MTRKLFAIAALAVTCCIPAAAATAAVASATGADFSIEPVAGRDGGPRPFFRLPIGPGEQAHDRLAVRNLGDDAITLRAGAVDAATGPLGGASYGVVGEPVQGTGSWLSLSTASLVVEPRATEHIDVTVSVPDDAPIGQHLAAIAVAPTTGAATMPAGTGGGLNAAVHLDTRRVVAVEVDVPGPTDPQLAVTGADVVARPLGLFVRMAMTNRGNALTTAEGRIEIPGLGLDQQFSVGTFVPGTSIEYPLELAGDVPKGQHGARVELRYGDRRATWEGVVVVGDETASELQRRQVDAPSRISSPAGVPWGVVAGVGALGIVLGAAFGFRRRRGGPTAARSR